MRIFQSKTKMLREVVAPIVATFAFCFGMSMLGSPQSAYACPFCTAASQTLRQEAMSMDVVAFGKLVTNGQTSINGVGTFKIDKVLIGDKLIKPGATIEATYFGPGESTKRFLLMGVDPKQLLWSSPLPISPDGEKYFESILTLPEAPVERLAFYQSYFEHPDSLLARDAYDEFALAPYSDVILLKDQMDRELLLSWVKDPTKSPERKRLYFTMLGICGTEEDSKTLEAMIKSDKPEDRAGLDALIAAYLTLVGDSGLDLIKTRFFDNKDCQYADIYSAVMALRFHGTELQKISKKAITSTMHRLLERPDLADLVIPDLARWEDWSQIERAAKLFEEAKDDHSWVRVPVVNYLRACPLPEAAELLVKLEKIDPNAVKRAKTFFPVPSPAVPKKGDSSAVPNRNRLDRGLVLSNLRHEIRVASLDRTSQQPNSAAGDRDSSTDAFSAVVASLPSGPTSSSGMNLFAPFFVVVLATIMLAMVMWTVANSSQTAARCVSIIYRDFGTQR